MVKLIGRRYIRRFPRVDAQTRGDGHVIIFPRRAAELSFDERRRWGNLSASALDIESSFGGMYRRNSGDRHALVWRLSRSKGRVMCYMC
jgi:hypothetical protein